MRCLVKIIVVGKFDEFMFVHILHTQCHILSHVHINYEVLLSHDALFVDTVKNSLKRLPVFTRLWTRFVSLNSDDHWSKLTCPVNIVFKNYSSVLFSSSWNPKWSQKMSGPLWVHILELRMLLSSIIVFNYMSFSWNCSWISLIVLSSTLKCNSL